MGKSTKCTTPSSSLFLPLFLFFNYQGLPLPSWSGQSESGGKEISSTHLALLYTVSEFHWVNLALLPFQLALQNGRISLVSATISHSLYLGRWSLWSVQSPWLGSITTSSFTVIHQLFHALQRTSGASGWKDKFSFPFSASQWPYSHFLLHTQHLVLWQEERFTLPICSEGHVLQIFCNGK